MKEIEAMLSKIELFVRIGNKNVLEFEEACVYTGYSKGHLYRLTSEHNIPHYKKERKIYFNKSELDRWMLQCRVKTNEEIDNEAATYLSINKRKQCSKQ